MQKPQRLPSLPVILSWSVLVVVILGAIGVVLLQGSLRTSQDTRKQADVGQQAVVLDGCVLTGCNGEICAEEDSGRVSTCVVRPEQACYKQSGVCRKQADGKCGWSQTDELKACLAGTKLATPSATPSATASPSVTPRPSATPRPLDTCADDSDCPTGQTCGIVGCRPGTQCLLVHKACIPKTSPPPIRPLPSPTPSLSPRINCQSDTNCPAGQVCRAQSCPAGTQCFFVPKYCVSLVQSPLPSARPLPSRIPTPSVPPRPSASPYPRCSTDIQCGPGQECYQPPMPPCPPGLACAQVMPPRVCRPKASPSPSPSPSASPILVIDPVIKLGDINGDGKVDLIDYSILRQEFLTSASNSKADLNRDGKVDLVDYSIFIQELKK